MPRQKRRTSADWELMVKAVVTVANRHEEVCTNSIKDEVLDEYHKLLCEKHPKSAIKGHVAKYRTNTLAMSQFISRALRKDGGWERARVDKGARQLMWRKIE
tara:strand:- start:326 stop:631 length:306 start_codon:yes stop_codon:yes gene_type:complete